MQAEQSTWAESLACLLPPCTCSAAQGYRPDYLYLLQRLCMDSPEGAVNLAKTIARQPGPPIDLNTLADLFLQRNMVREATAFLLDVLQDNDPAHDKLQTKVGGGLFWLTPPARWQDHRSLEYVMYSHHWCPIACASAVGAPLRCQRVFLLFSEMKQSRRLDGPWGPGDVHISSRRSLACQHCRVTASHI